MSNSPQMNLRFQGTALMAVHVGRQFLQPEVMGLREHNGNTVVQVSLHSYIVGDIVSFWVQRNDRPRCYQHSRWCFRPVKLISNMPYLMENENNLKQDPSQQVNILKQDPSQQVNILKNKLITEKTNNFQEQKRNWKAMIGGIAGGVTQYLYENIMNVKDDHSIVLWTGGGGQLQCESPYILKLHGMCETDSDYVLVCDYMDGGDLFDCILSQHVGSRALEIFHQVARGVKACHDANIAHRDIKPENILLDRHWNVKLADFGLSLRVINGAKVSQACGSLNYIAPELQSKIPYDAKPADIWSLGIVLYGLVTGYLPTGEDGNPTDPLSPANVGVGHVKDPQVRDLLTRMLASKPGDRIDIDELVSHPCLRRERIKRCYDVKNGS